MRISIHEYMTTEGTSTTATEFQDRALVNALLDLLGEHPLGAHINREWCESLISGVSSEVGVRAVIDSLSDYMTRPDVCYYLRRIREACIRRNGGGTQRLMQQHFAALGYEDTWPAEFGPEPGTLTDAQATDEFEARDRLPGEHELLNSVGEIMTINEERIRVRTVEVTYDKDGFQIVTIKATSEQIIKPKNIKPRRRRRSIEL
jgi:hypothetical protein